MSSSEERDDEPLATYTRWPRRQCKTKADCIHALRRARSSCWNTTVPSAAAEHSTSGPHTCTRKLVNAEKGQSLPCQHTCRSQMSATWLRNSVRSPFSRLTTRIKPPVNAYASAASLAATCAASAAAGSHRATNCARGKTSRPRCLPSSPAASPQASALSPDAPASNSQAFLCFRPKPNSSSPEARCWDGTGLRR